MSAIDLLHRVSLFSDLPDEELRRLSASLGKRTFARDVILFHKGSPSQVLYLIESGMVRAFAVSERGQEITLDIYGSGQCFGEAALLDGQMRSAAAMTLEPTIAYLLQRDDFLRCLEEHPKVARRALTLLADQLNHLTTFAENLAFLNVSGRVAAVLLEIADRYGVDEGSIEINLHLTQSELASWCAASRVMINKVLGAFRDEMLITLEGRTITILDRGGLKRKMTY